jgi:hypothetical protein
LPLLWRDFNLHLVARDQRHGTERRIPD